MLEKVAVLDHGYIKLLDVMGSDEDIVDAARISYDRRGTQKDRALLRYLMRNRHTSPFEMAEMKFEIKMPIFVARQWVRHRTASLNEVSARYTKLPDDIFVPEKFAIQSKDNKQGRGDEVDADVQREAKRIVELANTGAYSDYEQLLGYDVANEVARGVLPLNIYTKMIWKMDLHNLLHFLHLRLHPHAQEEIRLYAEAINHLVSMYFPITHDAFYDYYLSAYTCSGMEVDVLKKLLYFYMHKAPKLEPKKAQAILNELDEHATSVMSERELKEFKRTFMPLNEVIAHDGQSG